jgi:hypothetical protein
MAIQIWTFACGHILTGEDPLLSTNAKSTSSEKCAGCKERALQAKKRDEQWLEFYRKQAEGLAGHLEEAEKDDNKEMVRDLKAMEKNCLFLWAKKVGEIELKEESEGNYAASVNPTTEEELEKRVGVLELLAKSCQHLPEAEGLGRWIDLYFLDKSVRKVSSDYLEVKAKLLPIEERIAETREATVAMVKKIRKEN